LNRNFPKNEAVWVLESIPGSIQKNSICFIQDTSGLKLQPQICRFSWNFSSRPC